jgi:hypothetical protein
MLKLYTRYFPSVLFIFFLFAANSSAQKEKLTSSNYISNSKIIMDRNNRIPIDIRFSINMQPTLNLFFTEYRKSFTLTGDDNFKLIKQTRDKWEKFITDIINIIKE